MAETLMMVGRALNTEDSVSGSPISNNTMKIHITHKMLIITQLRNNNGQLYKKKRIRFQPPKIKLSYKNQQTMTLIIKNALLWDQ